MGMAAMGTLLVGAVSWSAILNGAPITVTTHVKRNELALRHAVFARPPIAKVERNGVLVGAHVKRHARNQTPVVLRSALLLNVNARQTSQYGAMVSASQRDHVQARLPRLLSQSDDSQYPLWWTILWSWCEGEWRHWLRQAALFNIFSSLPQ